MPSRRSGGGSGGTVKRKHSLGNLRRAHPSSGATWNVQVVRGKMSSKCLWHACRALILGVTLMLLGAGMATLGYYADHLSMGSEIRGNVTVRVKNDLKGFHLNNFAYVGPIVMGFGGFIVVASCVMTFEARDSAAKVVPARLRAGGGSSKNPTRSNQSSSASQRRGMGAQYQSTRWDQHFGVFRSSPGDTHQQPQDPYTNSAQYQQQPFDREALTAELIKFSKSLRSTRFSPQLRRLTFTGSVPNLSTINATANCTTNHSNLLSLNHLELHQYHQYGKKRHHHRRHRHSHNKTVQLSTKTRYSSVRRVRQTRTGISGTASGASGPTTRLISNSSSLIQRATRGECALLQPPPSASSASANRVYWQASSFDGGMGMGGTCTNAPGHEKRSERNKRSDTSKRHVLSRQRPIEHEEAGGGGGGRERCSPLGNRRNSTLSDSSYSGRWTARCASIASRTSSIDSRRIQVDLHSPEVIPKSILRSPKRYSSGPSATPSVEKEFRSQLSVCSEPPQPVRQLSGQSSIEPCVPEEIIDVDVIEEHIQSQDNCEMSNQKIETANVHVSPVNNNNSLPLKKARPDSLPLATNTSSNTSPQEQSQSQEQKTIAPPLYRSNSSRQFYRPKPGIANERDDSIFYIRSMERGLVSARGGSEGDDQMYDSLRVINERRSTLLKADSQSSLGSAERKLSSFSLKMPDITERENSIDVEEPPPI